jgi:pimeloyl-ACP methyl ester carboxylesterase
VQRPHLPSHLLARTVVAAVSNGLMFSGLYPLLPHALLATSRRRRGRADRPGAVVQLRAAMREWSVAVATSAARPAGFWPLPGAHGRGPRPIVVVHGYAMNRANFVPLAWRLARAGLGPIVGFEYWTLGRTARAARELGAFVDEVRARTGAAAVDVIGHSMGGVVGRYYVTLGGGDGVVANLVTIGSPHRGTEVSAIGVGHPARELVRDSNLMTRLTLATPPAHTRTTVIWSRVDALVPGARQARIDGAEELVYDDLGHLSLLASRRVAEAIIARLGR